LQHFHGAHSAVFLYISQTSIKPIVSFARYLKLQFLPEGSQMIMTQRWIYTNLSVYQPNTSV